MKEKMFKVEVVLLGALAKFMYFCYGETNITWFWKTGDRLCCKLMTDCLNVIRDLVIKEMECS